MSKAAKKSESLVITDIDRGSIVFCLRGNTPLVYNAMSAKVKGQLLMPKGRKTAAEKATTLKHEPYEEYRTSVYRRRDHEKGPTRLTFPAGAFKQAMVEASGRVPGGVKAAVKQLLWPDGLIVDMYGVPQIFMAVVRSADINKTPDVRTRAILPEWACKVTFNYVRPMLTQTGVSTLIGAAGLLMGVGDGRQQKGALNFGQFEVVNEDDEVFVRLHKTAGMAAQDAALREPIAYDQETQELLSWFDEQLAIRTDNVTPIKMRSRAR